MASFRKWTEIIFSLIFTLVAFCPVPETSCVSYRLNHQGLFPTEKKFGNPSPSQYASNPKQKQKKKVLTVSKNLFQKLAKNHVQMEKEAEHEHAQKNQTVEYPVANKINKEQGRPPIKTPNEFYDTPRKFPESVMKYNSTSTQLEKKASKYKPYYDCSLYFYANADGSVIIKPDPFDCGCFYYCSAFGIHHVTCCPWPLLWNDDILSCDWYWKVYCYNDWKKS